MPIRRRLRGRRLILAEIALFTDELIGAKAGLRNRVAPMENIDGVP
jgi:hypothetical protein